MSITLGEAILYLRGDGSDLDKSLKDADKKSRGIIGGLGDFANKGFGGLKKAVGVGILGGVGAVAAGLGALAVAFSDSEELARTQINAEKQLDAVLASTGGAAGMTARELKDLASSLQGVTNFGDEATIQGQSLLLTFTSIGRDVFPRATETMLDMSQALGQDMKSSAVQLGKALNDPIVGMTALSRVGVSFTEQQKEQIKTLQESGDIMGAQTIILDELAKEFGGSARAMADPTIQMSNAFGDLKEVVGGVVVRFKNDLAEKALPLIGTAITKTTELIKGLTEGGWGLSETLTFLAANLGLGALNGKALADTITGAIDRVVAFKNAALEFLAPIAAVIGSFVSWQDVLMALGIVVAAIVLPILGSIVASALPIIAVGAALVASVALVRKAWENDWGGIRTALTGWWDGTGKPIFGQLQTWLADNLPAALSTLQKYWQDYLLPALRLVWTFIDTNLIPLFRVLIDVWFAAMRVQLAVLQAAFENVFLPALRTVWAFVRDNIIPIFDGMSNSIGGIGGAIQTVIGWLRSLGDWLNNVANRIPDIFRPGSPTPFELGFRGIADGMREMERTAAGLTLNGSLRAAVAGGRGDTYNVTIPQNFNGNADPASVARAARAGAGTALEMQRRRGR